MSFPAVLEIEEKKLIAWIQFVKKGQEIKAFCGRMSER